MGGKNSKNYENQGPPFDLYEIKSTQLTYPVQESSLTLLKKVEGYYITEELMTRIYEQHVEELNGKAVITPQIRKIVLGLCKFVNEQNCYTTHKKILDVNLDSMKTIPKFKRVFVEKFIEIAQFGRHFRKTFEDRLVNHFSISMLLFPIIIKYIEEEDPQVYELLKQIALFHSNIWIQPEDLKMYFVYLVNVLIHEEFANAEHIKPLVIFFMTLSNYFVKYLENYCKCRIKDVGIDRYFSRYRKNYRQLKKWKILINDLNNKVITWDNEFGQKFRVEEKTLVASESESLTTLFKKSRLFRCFFKKTPSSNA